MANAESAESVATNLLGRYVVWYGDRGSEGGWVVAVTFYRGDFVLLVQTDEGLKTRRANDVKNG